ncbi:hypothetical protein Peur_059147 [Populus x canadensis]
MPFDPSSDARAIKTPFIQDSVRRLAIELGFEATQTPFYLSFLLKLKSSGAEIRNHSKANFCVPVGLIPDILLLWEMQRVAFSACMMIVHRQSRP